MTNIQIEQSNFIYRHPDLAERIRRSTADAHAQRWIDLIKQHHPGAKTVLEFGCWTGMDAERLAGCYDVVGVDVQPHLIDYARKHRSGPEFSVGNIINARLGRTFDALLCVGNSLSYVHDAAALDAAFATFTAHAHPGALLIIQTLLAPTIESKAHGSEWIDVQGLKAAYIDRAEWCPLTQLLTTRRTWRYDDGSSETDLLCRRVLPAPELELRASLAGWDVLSVDFDPPGLAGCAVGDVGCLVARFRGAAGERRESTQGADAEAAEQVDQRCAVGVGVAGTEVDGRPSRWGEGSEVVRVGASRDEVAVAGGEDGGGDVEPLLRRLADVDLALSQVPDAATVRLRKAIDEFRETTTARATVP